MNPIGNHQFYQYSLLSIFPPHPPKNYFLPIYSFLVSSQQLLILIHNNII